MVAATPSAAASEEGFSLIEVVMAMMVITIALLALIPVQTQALATVRVSQERQQATGFASGALERARAANPAAVSQGRALTPGDEVDAQYVSDEPLITTGGATPDASLKTRICSEQSGCGDSGFVVGTAFVTRLYVSQPSVPGAVTVTAVTTWTSATSPESEARNVTLRTRIASVVTA